MVWLIFAILLEVSGTISMKLSQGFTKLWPSVSMFVFYILSLASLNFALKTVNVSIAYAIWAGVGTALIATIGILWFKEPATAIKLISIALVILGIVGLNFTSSH